jgi:acid phosphatase
MVTLRQLMAAVAFTAAASAASAGPPMYDHIVVVVEENRSLSQVIGSSDAPFINALAATGASLTDMYGLTHPSQPNYLHLFSGSNQGVTSNVTPTALPFATANVGAALAAAGRSFTAYSESLPSVGFTGDSFSANPPLNEYVRKHNPWTNWLASSPTGNQLPASVAQPFTAFPTDYTLLPQVSFVIPNEQHNMHDGSIAQADAWLQSNLGGYAAWAAANNSLLIVTWDEDNSAERNRIPTIFSGANVRQGDVGGTWTLHNLLRTLEDMNGASHSGSAAAVQPIVGPFTSDPAVSVTTFQQGDAGGYASATDTWIEAAAAAMPHDSAASATIDGSPLSQGLVRFDDLFGAGGRIPDGATIHSAKLTILTDSNSSADSVSLHRMLVPWSDTATWSTFGSGVDTDGLEAAATAEFQLIPNVLDANAIFDVTGSLLSWQADPTLNHGWLLQDATGTDGWVWHTAEAASLGQRPMLSVVYSVPEPVSLPLAVAAVMAWWAAWRTARPSANTVKTCRDP